VIAADLAQFHVLLSLSTPKSIMFTPRVLAVPLSGVRQPLFYYASQANQKHFL
jgi:hypothetical protein